MNKASISARSWKFWVIAGLGALLLADAALGYTYWSLRQSDPVALRAERGVLESKSKLLKADVTRCEQIQKHMPDVRKQADAFYKEQLQPVGTGYSAVVGDLGELATKAGLRATATTFRQKELRDRGVTQVDVSDTVEGDYAAIVKFIGSLERSKNFYLLSDLGLDSGTSGAIRVKLELRTYFRS